MTAIVWDQTGDRFYETGVSHGVLYIPTSGVYSAGVGWNGLTMVTESPTGAENTSIYANNQKYLSMTSVEEFGATIEAYTYPDEFDQFDGFATPTPGVNVGQQNRTTFGLAYRSLVGNDVDYDEHGYKINLVYGCKASPSERSRSTVNESPEALTFSWELTTTPVAVTGYKATALLVIDSRAVDATALAAFEDILYGVTLPSPIVPRLPLPDEVITHFAP